VQIEEKELLFAVLVVGFIAGERSWAQDVGGWRQQLSCASDHEAAVDLIPLVGTGIDMFGGDEKPNQGHQNDYQNQLVAVPYFVLLPVDG
jgi:hypothetical protein